MTRATFRILLAAALATMALGAIVDLVFPSLLPDGLARASEELPVPPAFSSLLPGIAVAAWALVSFASLIGLFFFKAWSRITLLASTVGGFALYPALGPSVSSWAAQALTDASSLLVGAVLVASYLEPVRHYFAQSDDA